MDDVMSIVYMMMEFLERDNLKEWAHRTSRAEVVRIKKNIKQLKLWKRLPADVKTTYTILESAQKKAPLDFAPISQLKENLASIQKNNSKGQNVWPDWLPYKK